MAVFLPWLKRGRSLPRELRILEKFGEEDFLVALLQGNWSLLDKLDLSGKPLPVNVVNLLFGVNIGDLIHRQETCVGELIISDWPVHGHWPCLKSMLLCAPNCNIQSTVHKRNFQSAD